MREEIKLNDCPTVLQQSVEKMQETLPSMQIFSVQKWDVTPYIDKSKVVTTYKVFAQYGYEVSIYTSSITVGGSVLDGQVTNSYVNMAELEVVATKSRWIGDDLKRILNDKPA